MTSGAVVLLVAAALAVAAGTWRAVTDGRFRGVAPATAAGPPVGRSADQHEAAPAAAVVLGAGGALGERATLLQFSSAFCAPCRATRQVLSGVAASVEGVAHVEVDAEHHLSATRELGVLRTPTTLVLDADGREVTRAAGAPTRAQVLTAVAGAVR